jgi:hypothetical protein
MSTEQDSGGRSFNEALLIDAAVTSQQVRISWNNLNWSVVDHGCVQLLTVLSTVCSAATSRPSAAVVREKKKKK